MTRKEQAKRLITATNTLKSIVESLSTLTEALTKLNPELRLDIRETKDTITEELYYLNSIAECTTRNMIREISGEAFEVVAKKDNPGIVAKAEEILRDKSSGDPGSAGGV